MQSNVEEIIDVEFEISGEKFIPLEELDNGVYVNHSLNVFNDKLYHQTLKTIHDIIFKNLWELISIEKLKSILENKLSFLDLVKVKLDFNSKAVLDSKYKGKYYVEREILYCWIYYNEKDSLKTFRFILDISNGEIKYLK